MTCRNERFYRVGDWDGKKNYAMNDQLVISKVKVVFANPKEFKILYVIMERIMEQILDTENVLCVVDITNNILEFSRDLNQCFFKKTSAQIRLITKSWKRKIRRGLSYEGHQIRISFSNNTIIVTLI